MNRFKYLTLIAITVAVAAGICLTVTAPNAVAQVGVNVNIGPAPDCPYGYYDVAPYACAPYGYYGPEWFVSGVFIGAGPWFHGPANFRGHVNNRLHPDHGYKGPMPKAGDQREASKPVDKVSNFKENEMRDGQGHVVKGKK